MTLRYFIALALILHFDMAFADEARKVEIAIISNARIQNIEIQIGGFAFSGQLVRDDATGLSAFFKVPIDQLSATLEIRGSGLKAFKEEFKISKTPVIVIKIRNSEVFASAMKELPELY